MEPSPRRRRLLALSAAIVLGLIAVVIAGANVATADASDRYQNQRHQLDQSLSQALQNGYTQSDLAPVTQRKSQLESTPEPFWVGSRPAYYQSQTQALADLNTQLKELQTTLLEQNRTLQPVESIVELACRTAEHASRSKGSHHRQANRQGRDQQIGTRPAAWTVRAAKKNA